MFFVEGPIGAGKTTFLKLIQEQLPELAVVFEPLHSWDNNEYGQSLLTNFYKDPKRWAYTMETLAMACRVQEHLREQDNPNPFRLMERSIYSGHYVFATNGYKNGFFTEVEWQVYLNWFNFLVTGTCKPPQGFIYLKVDPEIAYKRIKKRNREAEKSISLEYLKQIHQCHEDFLVHKKDLLTELKEVPVLILDCNAEFEADAEQLAVHARKLSAFVNMGSLRPAKPISVNV